MTYTKFGEFMRVLRVRHHEVMGDVAKLLGVLYPSRKPIREMWRCSLHVHSMESMRIQLKKYWHY